MSLPSDHYSENNGFQWNGPQENCPIPDVDSCNGKYKPFRVLQNNDWNLYHYDYLLSFTPIYICIIIYILACKNAVDDYMSYYS